MKSDIFHHEICWFMISIGYPLQTRTSECGPKALLSTFVKNQIIGYFSQWGTTGFDLTKDWEWILSVGCWLALLWHFSPLQMGTCHLVAVPSANVQAHYLVTSQVLANSPVIAATAPDQLFYEERPPLMLLKEKNWCSLTGSTALSCAVYPLTQLHLCEKKKRQETQIK